MKSFVFQNPYLLMKTCGFGFLFFWPDLILLYHIIAAAVQIVML